MTRQEFIDDIADFGELILFCYNVQCRVCDDIYSEDDRDEVIEDELNEAVRNDSWREIRDWLSNITTGYEWYRRDNWGDWCYVDDEFSNYKNDVLEWMDENAMWDGEEEEEEADEEFCEEGQEPIEEEESCEPEDFSFEELYTSSVQVLCAVRDSDNTVSRDDDLQYILF